MNWPALQSGHFSFGSGVQWGQTMRPCSCSGVGGRIDPELPQLVLTKSGGAAVQSFVAD